MNINRAMSQQVLIRARLLGADIADMNQALNATVGAGKSLAHLVIHPSGGLVNAFISRRPPQSAFAVVSQPEPFRPAFQPSVSRL